MITINENKCRFAFKFHDRKMESNESRALLFRQLDRIVIYLNNRLIKRNGLKEFNKVTLSVAPVGDDIVERKMTAVVSFILKEGEMFPLWIRET
jgi:hypothetical protein